MVGLSPTDLAQAPNAPLVIDVRSGLEYRTGHVDGAQNLSLPRILLGLGVSRWFLPQWFRDLSPDQPIATQAMLYKRPLNPTSTCIERYRDVSKCDPFFINSFYSH